MGYGTNSVCGVFCMPSECYLHSNTMQTFWPQKCNISWNTIKLQLLKVSQMRQHVLRDTALLLPLNIIQKVPKRSVDKRQSDDWFVILKTETVDKIIETANFTVIPLHILWPEGARIFPRRVGCALRRDLSIFQELSFIRGNGVARLTPRSHGTVRCGPP